VGVVEGHLRLTILTGCEDGHPQQRSRNIERSPARVDWRSPSLCESGTAYGARKYEHVMNTYSRLRG